MCMCESMHMACCYFVTDNRAGSHNNHQNLRILRREGTTPTTVSEVNYRQSFTSDASRTSKEVLARRNEVRSEMLRKLAASMSSDSSSNVSKTTLRADAAVFVPSFLPRRCQVVAD